MGINLDNRHTTLNADVEEESIAESEYRVHQTSFKPTPTNASSAVDHVSMLKTKMSVVDQSIDKILSLINRTQP